MESNAARLLSSVDSVLVALAERSSEAEALRRVPDASIEELRRAGLFRALVPSSHGGSQLPIPVVFEAATRLASACTSTAWVGMLSAVHAVITGWFDRSAWDDVWGKDPDALIASSFAPIGKVQAAEGGYMLRGTWKFSSGINHAPWAILGAMLPGETGERTHALFLVPAADFEVHDDWRVAGLKGTGSNSLSVREAFVPRHRVETMAAIDAGEAAGMKSGAPYLVPWRGLFSYSFAPAALGTAVAAISAYRNQVATRRSAYTGAAQREKGSTKARLAKVLAELEVARLLMARDVEWLSATAAGADKGAFSARVSFQAAVVVDTCARIVTEVYRAGGGGALYDSSPLQRYFRDIHAVTQHPGINLDILGELYGQALIDDPALAAEGYLVPQDGEDSTQ